MNQYISIYFLYSSIKWRKKIPYSRNVYKILQMSNQYSIYMYMTTTLHHYLILLTTSCTGTGWARKTSSTPPLFYEMSVLRNENQRLCFVCDSDIDIASVLNI